MKNFIKIFCCACALVILTGCSEDTFKILTFHKASVSNYGNERLREPVTMPTSGFTVTMDTEPFMYNSDIERVDVAKVKMPDDSFVFGFYFITTLRGQKNLFRATAGNLNNFVVVRFDGMPVGLRQIDTTITDGKIFVVADAPEGTDLQKMSEEMNAAIKTANEIKEDL